MNHGDTLQTDKSAAHEENEPTAGGRERIEAETQTCCHKTKERSAAEYKSLVNRLSRIEGQVRGIRSMVEEERYCVDIITQVSAISSALNAFNKALLSQHIKTCVADNIRNGNDEVVDELCETLKKLMK